jgi:RNA methyltransferase, TrmH family
MAGTIKITSKNNERLVRFRKVRDGKVPEHIFIEGLRLAEEALRSDLELLEAVLTPPFDDTDRGRQLVDELGRSGIPVLEISDALFKTIADTTHSQGVAIIASRPQTGPGFLNHDRKSPGPALLLYHHETNDPSNLGAVLRTAEAAGVSGVILSEGSTDPFSPKALRAGMGANLRVPIWDRAEPSECVEWARGRGFRIVAADIHGSRSYTDIDWKKPTLLMLGSEAHGLDNGVLGFADEVISIPMKNGVESLNLAVSAGIILFEAVRQNS